MLVIDLRGGPGRRVEPVDEELRQSSTCSAPGTLPFGETFDPYGRGPVYSLPFHAAKGRTIHVDVSAQFESSTRSDNIDHTFGVEVFQCCVVSDERLAPQMTEVIGPAGSPRHILLDVTVSDANLAGGSTLNGARGALGP